MKINLRALEFLIAGLPIKLAWFLYVITLQQAGGDESHGWAFDKWQHECIFTIFEKRYVCINRCRGGSKTRDMAALCVFFRLRGLIVVWMSANRKQLVRAQTYWNEIPFVINSPVSINKDFIHLKNGTFFQIFVLKKGLNNDRGPRAHVIFYDEMSQMDKDLVENTRSFSAGMDWDGSPIFWIMFSTPEINTIFHECAIQYPCITHDIFWPSWFSAEYIRMQRLSLGKAKFEQEHLCLFVSMAGSLLDGHLNHGHAPVKLEPMEYIGLDPNAREGYVVVTWRYSKDFKIAECVHAHNYGPGSMGKKLALEYIIAREKLHPKPQAELETNGIGMPVYDDYVDMGGDGMGMFWDMVDKIRRINLMTKTQFYIPTAEGKEYAELFVQLSALSLTIKGDAIDKPDEKPWHFADSGMHAASASGIIWA